MKKVFLFGFAVCLFLILALLLQLYTFWVTPFQAGPGPARLQIPRGCTLKDSAGILADRGIISSPSSFLLLARLKGVENKIKSGEYLFSRPLTPAAVLEKLTRGEVATHAVTIPEGSTLADIARILESAGFGAADHLQKRATDTAFLKKLGADNESLEGFLFPDTYRFSRGIGADAILESMVSLFQTVYARELESKSLEAALTDKEIITLASLVERETPRPEEKPVVAAVFLNRLRKKMRMECDPTVIYGLLREDPDFRGRLRKKHLKKWTPYNTYLISGLPPGPICSPGRESIRAVLNPAKVPYLYFVSKNDGTHHFSATLKEHNRAVHKYQKRGRRR